MTFPSGMASSIGCEERLELRALPGIPLIRKGDLLPDVIGDAIEAAGWQLHAQDVLVVTSKVVSRAEGRFVDLGTVEVSERALELARITGGDARVVELVLRESELVSRAGFGALVVRHRQGYVVANAGIDASNAAPDSARVATGEVDPGDTAPVRARPVAGRVDPSGDAADQAHHGAGPWVLLPPEAPDRSAASIRQALEARFRVRLGIVVSDSFGRPFRVGSVGAAIGLSGIPPYWDQRGERDLFGRTLEHTITALADQVATAADLVAGQASEGRAVVLVRGLRFPEVDAPASELCRPIDGDLYLHDERTRR